MSFHDMSFRDFLGFRLFRLTKIKRSYTKKLKDTHKEENNTNLSDSVKLDLKIIIIKEYFFYIYTKNIKYPVPCSAVPSRSCPSSADKPETSTQHAPCLWAMPLTGH